MFTIVTVRFNNETWDANVRYRERKKFQCLYATPHKLSESIDINSPVFVIEMNNSINQIMGIGLIKNKIVMNKTYKIQEDSNYNRYSYVGNYHISREIIDDYNPELVYVLDEILFKGYTHSKRGSGMTKIPEKVLKLDICENMDIKKEIKNLFIYHFRDKILESKNDNNLTNKN
jgi:hypothetical protein